MKPVTVKKIVFKADGLKLVGNLHLPDSISSPPVVIGSHGLFSSRVSPKQIELAERCCKTGIGYFRYDHRGCGESEGHFQTDTTLESRCRDLRAAVRTVQAQFASPPQIAFFGSSLGGAVSLNTARKCNVSAIVVFATPLHSRPIYEAIKNAADMRGLPESFFLEQLAFDITDICPGLNRILIFHGTDDHVVPVNQAKLLFNTAKKPKKLILQQNGDHQMQSGIHQLEFMDETLKWVVNWFDSDFTRSSSLSDTN